MMIVLGKGVKRAERGYNNMNKIFLFRSIFYTISILPNISITSLGLVRFIQELIYVNERWGRCHKAY